MPGTAAPALVKFLGGGGSSSGVDLGATGYETMPARGTDARLKAIRL
ncbi:MAG: hypothetical protein ACJAVR_003690 [Paracoccaceae bacterium]